MFTIYSDCGSDSTMVSNLFIDEYMERANDAQIKIYLYLLRMMGAHRSTSVSDMADRFNHTEKDVVRSLRYWEREGLLSLRFGEGTAHTSICLYRPASQDRRGRSRSDSTGYRHPAASPAAEGDSMPSRTSAAAGDRQVLVSSGPAEDRHVLAFSAEAPRAEYPEFKPCLRLASGGSLSGQEAPSSAFSRPSLPPDTCTGPAAFSSRMEGSGTADAFSGDVSAAALTADSRTDSAESPVSVPVSGETDELEALEAFRSNEEGAGLLFVIEQYIGKPLSLNEIRIIYGIYRNLKFSGEMIDYLLQYCVDRGRKDFRYIEKVASNWAKEGIMTPAQAESSTASRAEKTAAEKKRRGKRKENSGASSSGKASDLPRRPRASNSFNQFEQNSYDFDSLEEQLLGTSGQ